MIRKGFLALGLTLFSDSAAWAIPQTLNFQGHLKESGNVVNDTRQMSFKIWDSEIGGNTLFTEPASGTTNVIVSAGVFSVVIGALTSGGIPLDVFDGSDRYVEVVVGATTLPRQKFTSVGNAFFAATASNLTANAAIQISSAVFTATGSNQYSLQTSSGINVQSGGVTAPFFSGTFTGNGAGLTGLSGTDSSKVAKAGDTMTGQLTLLGSTLTITGNAFSVGATSLAVAGGKIGVGTSSPATKLHLSSGTLTIDGSGGGINVVGPSSASYFYGDGSGLINVTGIDSSKVARAGDGMTGPLTLSGSTLTVTGNAFSVGGSSLVVADGRTGVGTAAPATTLDVNGSVQFGSGALKSTFTATAGGSTYALQLSSGVTIANGGPINLSAGAYIKFNDGTTMTSTASLSGGGGSGGVAVATRAIGEFSFSNTTADCYSGSELTLNMNGGRVLFGFEGDALNITGGSYTQLGVKINGSLVDGQTSTGLIMTQMNQANYRTPASFTHLTGDTYTGSTTICLAKLVSSSLGYVCANYAKGCRVWAMEIK